MLQAWGLGFAVPPVRHFQFRVRSGFRVLIYELRSPRLVIPPLQWLYLTSCYGI